MLSLDSYALVNRQAAVGLVCLVMNIESNNYHISISRMICSGNVVNSHHRETITATQQQQKPLPYGDPPNSN